MGCCLSSGCKPWRRRIDGGTPPQPSPPVEEETVKEVLLETPVRPKSAISSKGIKEKPHILQERKVEFESEVGIDCSNPPKVAEEIVSEVSEVSEMRSVGESLEFSNTTAPERNHDEEGEVNQRPPPPTKRRQGDVGVRRRVPARRPLAAPLPEKRVQVVPLTPVRSRPAGGHRRDVDAEKRGRKDAGGSSSRRSRSPSKRGDVSGQRNTAESETVERGVVDGSKGEANSEEPPHGGEPAEEVESLENPVVSLECFIFL